MCTFFLFFFCFYSKQTIAFLTERQYFHFYSHTEPYITFSFLPTDPSPPPLLPLLLAVQCINQTYLGIPTISEILCLFFFFLLCEVILQICDSSLLIWFTVCTIVQCEFSGYKSHFKEKMFLWLYISVQNFQWLNILTVVF